MKFGRLVDGKWLDVQTGASKAVIESMFVASLISAWDNAGEGFSECPADAEHGDTDNGDGTVTKPPPLPSKPVVFNGADWREYAYRKLGEVALPAGTPAQQDMAGLVRYGGILKAARASTDDGVIAALDQYDDATNFRKEKVLVFLGLLNSTDPKIVTDAEFADIMTYWPNA